MVYVLLGTGFEETEAIVPVDLLRRAGMCVQTVGLNGRSIQGSHGIWVEADISIDEINLPEMEMIVLPGGLGGVDSIRSCNAAMEAIRYARDNGKYTAAICAGPTVLADLKITDGRRATCYPGCEGQMGNAVICADSACVQDGTLITAASAGCATAFGLGLIRALRGAEAEAAIAEQIVIR